MTCLYFHCGGIDLLLPYRFLSFAALPAATISEVRKMHPILHEGVSIGTFQYEGSSAVHFYVKNDVGDEFEIGSSLCSALLKADGTMPLDLPDKGRRLIPKLKKHRIIRTSRFVKGPGLINRFILFPIRSKGNQCRSLFKVIHSVLPVIAMILFFTGVLLTNTSKAEAGNGFNWWLYYGLALASVALHEAGHLTAGLAYGYEMSDTGILLLGILPIGAYVAAREKKNASKAERILFALAGIAVNLMLAGICLIVAQMFYPLSFTLTTVANVNVLLAGINLLPTSGLDGEAALSAVFDVASISKAAVNWLESGKRRRVLFHSGVPGYACLCVFGITLLSKLALWLIIAANAANILFNLF